MPLTRDIGFHIKIFFFCSPEVDLKIACLWYALAKGYYRGLDSILHRMCRGTRRINICANSMRFVSLSASYELAPNPTPERSIKSAINIPILFDRPVAVIVISTIGRNLKALSIESLEVLAKLRHSGMFLAGIHVC